MKQQSSFFADIYTLVAKIPKGNVMTYGQIALLLGRPRAARVVGYAMHMAPKELGLPCQRVVNRKGELSPSYVFGEGSQKSQLEDEGVTFLPDGKINLAKHLWKI